VSRPIRSIPLKKALMRNLRFWLLLSLGSSLMAAAAAAPAPPGKVSLSTGWRLQSSAKVNDDGQVISTPHFHAKDWYAVQVPTTVLAALVKNKVYPDPDFGMNLRQIPGTTYPIGSNFSNLPMPPDSPFAVPWWYRTTFSLPASYKGKTLWLNFKGINYRANVWLNGKQIATDKDVAGTFRTYEFDVTGIAKAGATNVLAVQVFAPTENDLAITFVDWNPAPPDKDMGLFREVDLAASGPVALRYPAVLSQVDPLTHAARLSVTAVLKNATNQPVQGVLRGRIENVDFAQNVELGPNEEKDVTFEPEKYPQLVFDHPRLWWPAQMGTPNLYRLRMQFDVNHVVSDRAETHFGIRQIDSVLDASNQRIFTINGKKILIRGGGWTFDMLLRENHPRMDEELRYVRDMGLNTIRLEGKLEDEHFFELADREGILVMAGWCCCDHWEHWNQWKAEDYGIARESVRSQIYRLRGHPSLVMWLNGSDNPPPADVEAMYLDVEKQAQWPNPIVSSASGKPAQVTGASGVKMLGPYEYVAPSYWLKDETRGGAYGFNTETSMGPAVPPIESMRRMLPKDHLWPIDNWWNFHAGGNEFKDISVFTEALNQRYGAADSARDFTFKSQLMTYEGVRAMFEAYSRNKYTSTGVIQWMLNDAWPSLIWHLYDYYLRPAGGYFGAKKAMEPLHPMYGYDDHSISVVSSQYKDAHGVKLSARIFNLDMTEKWSQEAELDVPADSSNRVFSVPEIEGLSPVYFLVLRLRDAAGRLVGSNFYWLSLKPETLAWKKFEWYVTPTESFADYTALHSLAQVRLKVSSRLEPAGENAVTHVVIENPSKVLAFFLRLKVDKGEHGEEILPVLWQDNYFSLLPGEKREVTATFRAQELGAASPFVEVRGWNVEQ
jgi:exo-1,4-beta-D-glucosaminidase